MTEIKRAIISVYDKSKVTKLAQFLTANGVEIISSGGTSKTLSEAGIPVTTVSDVTGFPEILGGRVKTLHPNIFSGILAKRETDHLQQLERQGLSTIDLVVVNLYPFEETISQESCSLEEAIEQIDIGGPSLIRAAAKNFAYTTVITSPAQYDELISEMSSGNGATGEQFRRRCAVAAFRTMARYNTLIAGYLDEESDIFHDEFVLQGRKVQDLRYGENPHQHAAFYRSGQYRPLAGFEQLHGKELSYNNIIDTNAALNLVAEFNEKACVILKHTNPCGAAIADSAAAAFQKALQTDPLSAFGGIIGFNCPVDLQAAEEVAQNFFECVIAPEFDNEALERLGKKKNLRLLRFDPETRRKNGLEIKTVDGGFLLQTIDTKQVDIRTSKVVTKRAPTEEEWQALEFAWPIVKHVKSNAIVFARNKQLIGVGAGQMSRVDSTEIAVQKSHKSELSTENTVVASDAFFPFRDGIEALARAGARAVIQPGGSIRDEEVIEAADQFGLAMVFTGIRHFKH